MFSSQNSDGSEFDGQPPKPDQAPGEEFADLCFPGIREPQERSAFKSDSPRAPIEDIYFSQASTRHLKETLENGSAKNQPALGFRHFSFEELRERRDLLRFGKRRADGESPRSFGFFLPGDTIEHAENEGLEGFLFSEAKLRQVFGLEQMLQHLPHYFNYLEHTLEDIPWAQDVSSTVVAFRDSELDDEEKYTQLIRFISQYVGSLRELIHSSDAALWAKRASIYSLFPRQYNLAAKRQVRGEAVPEEAPFFQQINRSDLESIRDENGCDTIWVMGLFPIGERGRLGVDGGSPYSIKDYYEVDPSLGSIEDVKSFVELAHSLGMQVIFDLVPNHTAMDARLLNEDPSYYIHQKASADEEIPEGYFEHLHQDQRYFIANGGYTADGPAWFGDTAQLDFSQPKTRQMMIDVALFLANTYQIDGLRIDMAYGLTNEYFSRRWERSVPEEEFLTQLHHALKAEHPHFGTFLEGYDKWDEMSASGADSIYGKNDMWRDKAPLHHGYYDSLVKRDPTHLKRALLRAEFLRWQTAGPNALMFSSNHDEPAPKAKFGKDWWKSAAVMTSLIPGSTLFLAGQEIGNDQANPEVEGDHKPLPFQLPVRIDWQNPDPESQKLYKRLFELRKHIHVEAQAHDMSVLPECLRENCPWVAYSLSRRGVEDSPQFFVVTNPSTDSCSFRFESVHGEEISGELESSAFVVFQQDASGLEVLMNS